MASPNVVHVKQTVKVFCKAHPDYSLTIRDDRVILAESNPTDESQHWYKEDYGTTVKDIWGFPSFALVNKVTGQAIKHAVGNIHPVQLKTYGADVLDESILWTEAEDLGGGFRAIRMAKNAELNLDASFGEEKSGWGTVGTGTIGLSGWHGRDNQRWKIDPVVFHVKQTVMVFCKAHPDYSLTIRDDRVILAESNPTDESQHWYKEDYGTRMKDVWGFPSFALVNEATGQAIKHAVGNIHPVQLKTYGADVLDESILWTEAEDLGGGFRAIRMAKNAKLNLDASFEEEKPGWGTVRTSTIGLWEWHGGDNQRWKIVPVVFLGNHTQELVPAFTDTGKLKPPNSNTQGNNNNSNNNNSNNANNNNDSNNGTLNFNSGTGK